MPTDPRPGAHRGAEPRSPPTPPRCPRSACTGLTAPLRAVERLRSWCRERKARPGAPPRRKTHGSRPLPPARCAPTAHTCPPVVGTVCDVRPHMPDGRGQRAEGRGRVCTFRSPKRVTRPATQRPPSKPQAGEYQSRRQGNIKAAGRGISKPQAGDLPPKICAGQRRFPPVSHGHDKPRSARVPLAVA